MEPLALFRTRILRVSLLITGVAALAALAWDADVALGVVMGGAAGTAAFWMLARRVERFAAMDATQIQASAMQGMFARMALYGATLTAAYLVNPETKAPLFAAALALLIPRMVLYARALRGSLGAKRSDGSA
jgi:hypothetical protein